MSFEFKHNESVEKSFKRIVRTELDQIIKDLGSKGRIRRDKAVHESRKRLKKLRALLRLMRDAISRKTAARENRTFRDAGRELSAARDAAVLITAFDQTLERVDGAAKSGLYDPVRSLLLARKRRAEREHRTHGLDHVFDELRSARTKLLAEKVRRADFNAIRPGLKRAFKQAREAFGVAMLERTAEHLHEWRKRVKDLLYHANLLEPVWPEVIGTFGEKLHALSDCLGEDHDLAVLLEVLSDPATPMSTSGQLDPVIAAVNTRRREVQHAAIELGNRIHSERPAAFIERIENYWNAWREAKLE